MARSHDNWERLVTATLRREDLRLTAERTPSELSLASLSSFSSFDLASSSQRLSSFDWSGLLVGDSLSYKQILKATDNLNKSYLIKHGTSGDLFYGVLERGTGVLKRRTQIIVKKIDLSSVNKESLFTAELEVLRKVSRHHRFVPLIGHCFENKEVKFLVYKQMAHKDLSTSLSRKIDSGNLRELPLLDWITRLKIATEVAEGLCYLHQCVPPVVHSNIQASSILLDDKFEVRLSLYEVCAEETPCFRMLFPGTSNESYALCSYDVYCFGKVLLELVTGRLGLSATDDSTTNGWMANVLSSILPDNAELIINIVDSSLVRAKHVLAQVWAVSFIAKACLSPESSKRPQMAQILLALEHIKSSSFTSESPKTTIFTRKSHKTTGIHDSVRAAIEIADILWGCKLEGWFMNVISTRRMTKIKVYLAGSTAYATADTETLGSGTASRNHKISEAGGFEEIYPNGEVFALPSLTIFSFSELRAATRHFGSDIAVGKVESGRVYRPWLRDMSSKHMKLFKSRVRSLGRLSHPNLVKFLGYCEDKNLLVHEFMQSGSLDNHLFRGSDVQPLSWGIRLNILIGAARGLAFLHATRKQGFYEYFGTSDILLDGAYNAKISGFGRAELILPKDEGIRSEVNADAPPENVFRTAGCMNVQSDVYGFGVVLVAMLTGLSTKRVHRLSWGKIHPVLYFLDLKRNRLEKILDPNLEGQCSLSAAHKLGCLASMCLAYFPESRPLMEEVVKILESVELLRKEHKSPDISEGSSTCPATLAVLNR